MTTFRSFRSGPFLLAMAAGMLAGCSAFQSPEVTDGHGPDAATPEGGTPAPAPIADAATPTIEETPGASLPTDVPFLGINEFAGFTPPFNPATSLYGDVMAKAMAAKTGEETRGGGSNYAQVSFSQEGADFDPSISRDGTQIVYASTQHRSSSDIYIKNVHSRVVTQLTNDAGNDVMPRISPDGGRIAFASNRAGNWDVFVMPITGGKAVQITSSAADDLHPSWSPDGSQLVFCRLGEVSGQWELWVTEVGNSGVARFIGYGLFPEWCPVAGTGAGGADRIAFQKSRERGDRAFGIWTVDYQRGEAGNVTEVASSQVAACINPAWSPDAQWLAFATVPNPSDWANSLESRPASADLWLADLNGSTRISLTSGKAVNLMPTWGPDNKLFFVSDRGGTDNIWALDTGKVIELALTNMRSSSAFAAGAQTPAKPGNGPPAPVATAPGEGDH